MYLPDTNIVSALVRGHAGVHARAEVAKRRQEAIVFSPLVEYEIERGLLRTGASTLRGRVEAVVSQFVDVPFTRSVWLKAAQLWAYSRDQAHPVPDSDILVAAQAIDLGAIAVTDNERHFRLFEAFGLQIENWL